MTTADTLVDAGMPWLDAQLLGATANTAAVAPVFSGAPPTLAASVNFFSSVPLTGSVSLHNADLSPMVAAYSSSGFPLVMFPAAGETINGNTSLLINTPKAAIFIPGLGNWVGIVSA